MPHDCHLYLLTPPALPADFDRLLAEALDAGKVAALQLRLKEVSDDEIRRAVLSADMGAVAAGLDRQVRAVVKDHGDAARLGDRAHQIDSRDLALGDGEAGADYVAFGAFFASVTKDTDIRAELELLSWWSEIMELPVVAIGGIDAANCGPLVRAGANFLAVTGAVWSFPEGPAAGVQAMNAAIAAA